MNFVHTVTKAQKMLDFKELPKDGIKFELLVREILFSQGFDTYWSGVGPDGGKDLLCIERFSSPFCEMKRNWLVQCKHFAHADRSVGTADLDSIADSCAQHSANGYLLACSTYASSPVTTRLANIANNPSMGLFTAILDGNMMERTLLTPQYYHVAQRFFPESSNSADWKVSRTDSPNHFIINFKGYLFHLYNRIGSDCEFHFNSIANRIADLEKIPFETDGEFLRPRVIWYDDKNGHYNVELDLMIPYRSRPTFNIRSIERGLGDGHVLEDGQQYRIHVVKRNYSPTSDHYDADHYNYYVPYLGSYLIGKGAERRTISDDEYELYSDDPKPIAADDVLIDAAANRPFNTMVEILSKEFGAEFLFARNGCPEAFSYVRDGSFAHLESSGWIRNNNFCGAEISFAQSARSKAFELVESLDGNDDCIPWVYEHIVFTPLETGKFKRQLDESGEEERRIAIRLETSFSKEASQIRCELNKMFDKISDSIRQRSRNFVLR